MSWYKKAQVTNDRLHFFRGKNETSVTQCSSCGKFRTETPDPNSPEDWYVHHESEYFSPQERGIINTAIRTHNISHGLCLDCAKKLYPELAGEL